MTRMVRMGAKCMPVNSTLLEYDANAAVWLRARNVFAREAAAKDIFSVYSPRQRRPFSLLAHCTLNTPSELAHYSLTATQRLGLSSQP